MEKTIDTIKTKPTEIQRIIDDFCTDTYYMIGGSDAISEDFRKDENLILHCEVDNVLPYFSTLIEQKKITIVDGAISEILGNGWIILYPRKD